MLTVKETLCNIDTTSLQKMYAMRCLNDSISLLKNNTLTIKEFIERRKNNAQVIIQNLLSADAVPSTSILFACHYHDQDTDDVVFELIEQEELLSEDWENKCVGYCYMAEDFNHIAGYNIADTHLTQRNLTDLLVDVIYEASWFGPNQEGREAFIQRLDNSIQEIEDAKLIEEIFVEPNQEPTQNDPNQESALKKLYESIYEYNRTCFLLEAEKIRAALITEGE